MGNFVLNRPAVHAMQGFPENPPVGTFPEQWQQPELDYQGWSAGGDGLMPPAANDQHSYAGMSDITSDPGY